MKKFLLLIILILISILCYNLTSAKTKSDTLTNAQNGLIKFVAPLNYFPISNIENFQKNSGIIYKGVFDTFIDDFCEKNQISCTPFIDTNYINTVKTAEKNKFDLIIGIYSDSILYEDFQFIYPSLLDNPVHLVMIPSRIGEITSLKDLKPLKGAINTNDQWNDYTLEQFKQFNIEQIDNPEEIYRKLISKEIDYVFTTYWYGISEIMRLGIQDFVAVSQNGLWNMPLFIAVSNYSPKKNYLVHYLTEYLKNPEVSQKIKARAIEVLEEIKAQNHGVVPDSYVLQKDAN